MTTGMKTAWILGVFSLVITLVICLTWLVEPRPVEYSLGESATQPASEIKPLRIGLIPERDIFQQRKRYLALADYLSKRLGRPVELATLNTYEGVLLDFAEKKIDGAFLGSLVGVLAMDRMGAKVVVKPRYGDDVTTYHGVLVVRGDSPIRTLEQLRGKSIAMVKATTAGHIFPGCVFMRLGLYGAPDSPKTIWSGTHDEALMKVVEGHADAGAIKNLRLKELLQANPDWNIRILARGNDVPNNGLFLRRDVSQELATKLSDILLGMDTDPDGDKALTAMGIQSFVPCTPVEYISVYTMVRCIETSWNEIGVPGPAPAWPKAWPEPWPKNSPHNEYKCYEENY